MKSDVKYSNDAMKSSGEAYFKLRNTLKFLLGNLEGYRNEKFEMNEHDLLGSSLSKNLVSDSSKDMEDMNLRGVYDNLMNFVKENSSSYLNLDLKCDLYEATLTDEKRLRRQEVLFSTLKDMLKVLAYVTPYLAEDAYQNLPDNLKEFESLFFL